MRPIHLTVEGLRSFRSSVPIDFTGRDHVAIVGDTGAGKSSILEAITYALYGRTMFTAKGNQELMNDTSTHLRVALRFRVSGETWEVVRTLKKDGKGKVGPAKAQLRRVGAANETIELVAPVGPVNERIEKLIGLDSDAFLRTVILPQGRFARLLVEDKPTERADILRQVWRADELQEAEALAGAARERATRLRVQLEQAASHYPEDPAAHLAQLTAEMDRARERARATAATADEARAAHKTLSDALRARTAAVDVIERLRAPVIDRAKERLAPIAARELEIAAQDAALVQRQADLATRLAEVPDDTDGPGVAEVASALATLPAVGPCVTAAETAAEEARRSAGAARQAAEHATRSSELAAAAGEQTARHAELRPPLAAAVETASDRRATVEKRYADCKAHRIALDDAQDALASRRNERAARAEQLDAARTEARRDEAAATAADERLKAVQRASAGEAAAYARDRQRLFAARDAADKRRLMVGQRYDECRTRAEAAEAAEEKLNGHREQQDALRRRLEAAEAEAREAGLRRREADEQLAARRRSDSAAAAASDLRAGDACPVCLRQLPAGWTAPAGAGLHEAITAAERAGKAADNAGNRVVALATARTGVERQLDEAVIEAGDTSEVFRTALKALGEDAGVDLHGALPDRDALLGPLDTALLDAADALARYERDHTAHVETLARQEQEARDTWEAAQRASVATGQRVAALSADLQGLHRQLDEAGNRAGDAADALAASFGTLGEAAETTLVDTLPDHDIVLGPFDAAEREASETLARHDREHGTLQKESTTRSMVAAATAEAAAGAQALAGVKRNAAAKALEQVNEAIRAVPAPYRPSLDLPADPDGLEIVDTAAVGERMACARDREQVLAGRATERKRLQKEITAAHDERTALARRNAAEVNTPINDIVRDLNAHRAVVMKAAWALDLDEDVPATVAPEGTRALRAGIEALRTTTENVTRDADERANTAATRADAARKELATIAARLVGDVDADDPDSLVEVAKAAANEAGFQERQKENDARQFARIVDDIQNLRALCQQAVDKELALTDLENALKPGAFPKWLTLRRSRDLLVYASRMLHTMSGGRYAFVDPQDTDAQWRVLDRDSGQARSPASLSGGEQFIASLSLALGMVEMMARSGGRLESLFLDEGFGSLDRNNLDTAVEALSTVAAGGRMVGVISHVRAVAEQIEHVLAVTRPATGSRVEWLTGTQRQRLSESDTGLEGASALAGLLE